MRHRLLNFFSPYNLSGLSRTIGVVTICLLAALKLPTMAAVPTGFILASVLMALTRRFRLLRLDLKRLPNINGSQTVESIEVDTSVSLRIEQFSVGRVVRSFGEVLYAPPRGTPGTIETIYLRDGTPTVVLNVRWKSGLTTLIRPSDLGFPEMSVFSNPLSVQGSTH